MVISEGAGGNMQVRRPLAAFPPFEHDVFPDAKKFGALGRCHEFWTDTDAGQLIGQLTDSIAQGADFV